MEIVRDMAFLGISGSLRAVSSNTAILRAAGRLAPPGVTFTLLETLERVPLFNPDRDNEAAPDAVTDLRAQLAASDGIWICSPEYAHGVPGALKNALDWIVSSGEFEGKPVALLNASRVSTHAQESLTETLTVMMAQVQGVRVPLPTNKIGEDAILADRTLRGVLQNIMDEMVRRVRERESK